MTDIEIIKIHKLKNGEIYRCKTNAVTLDLWIKIENGEILSTRDREYWKPISKMIRSSLFDKWIVVFKL